MAISTYAELQTAVSNWLNRSDLTSRIPEFIVNAETRIAFGSEAPFPSKPVRVPAMMNRSTGTVSSGAIAFPTGFIEVIRLAVSSGGSSYNLKYVAPDQFTALANESSDPCAFTFLNNQIETAPTGSLSYTLDYYKKFDALATTSSNWLLTNFPAVYLYGALIEAAPYLMDDPRVQTWHGMYVAAVGGTNRALTRPPSGSLAVRVEG